MRSFRGAGKSLPVSRTVVKARALHEAHVRGLDFKASNGIYITVGIEMHMRILQLYNQQSAYTCGGMYMGQCKRKLGFCNFFQVFKFNSFWIQECALYKKVLTHPKLDSVS